MSEKRVFRNSVDGPVKIIYYMGSSQKGGPTVENKVVVVVASPGDIEREVADKLKKEVGWNIISAATTSRTDPRNIGGGFMRDVTMCTTTIVLGKKS